MFKKFVNALKLCETSGRAQIVKGVLSQRVGQDANSKNNANLRRRAMDAYVTNRAGQFLLTDTI